ncbi:MAG TPA: hypothetical protein VK524_15320, partial [Polyangiaceae bacterium]|nr:hypothetical protein [Polyangiaceae bacterium]
GLGSNACVLGFALTVSACSSDDRPGAYLDNGVGLPSCDIRSVSCQRTVFARTAALRGQRAERLPKVRTATVEQLMPEFLEIYASDSNSVTDAWARVFGPHGLLPDGESSSEITARAYLENVAAFYDPSNAGITILDRGRPVDAVNGPYVLAHEFVHALQDRSVDLAAFRERWVTSTDTSVATTALVEGEATLLSSTLALERNGIEPADFDWELLVSDYMQSVFASMTESEAPLLTATQSVVYPVGTAYLLQDFIAGGVARIAEVYAEPPRSVLHWVTGAWGAPSLDVETLDCHPTGAPPGYRGIDHDSLGVAGLFALQGVHLPAEFAWTQSLAVRADSMVLFADGDALAESSAVAMAWRIRFDSATSAAQFVANMNGAPGTWSIELPLGERELLIRTASDPSIVSSWSVGCGRADELPRPVQALRVRRLVPPRLPPLPRSRVSR